MKIRKIVATDSQEWDILYKGYAKFYNFKTDAKKLQILWNWLLDETNEVEGLVAEEAGFLVGLAHFRRMPSPLRGEYLGFLDDIFVLPQKRGGLVAKKLILKIKIMAKQRGWKMVRWITRDYNYRARNFYDKIAEKTDWALYEMKI